MRYCKKCGNRLDDLDGYCSNCGAKVELSSDENVENKKCEQDKRTSIEDAINNITDTASQNTESFLCFLLGILSVTCGTFVCGIISLVFGKKAMQLGQTNDSKCAMYCKVGKICSIVSIVMTAVGVFLSIVCWLFPLLFGLMM